MVYILTLMCQVATARTKDLAHRARQKLRAWNTINNSIWYTRLEMKHKYIQTLSSVQMSGKTCPRNWRSNRNTFGERWTNLEIITFNFDVKIHVGIPSKDSTHPPKMAHLVGGGTGGRDFVNKGKTSWHEWKWINTMRGSVQETGCS